MNNQENIFQAKGTRIIKMLGVEELGSVREIMEDVWLEQDKLEGIWKLRGLEKWVGPYSSVLVVCGWSLGFVLRAESCKSTWRGWVISVRWQDRRSQPSFSPRNNDLTTTCRQKYLCESSGVQLGGSSTPADHKKQDEPHWKGRKSSVTLLVSPLPQAGKPQRLEKFPSPQLLPQSKERAGEGLSPQPFGAISKSSVYLEAPRILKKSVWMCCLGAAKDKGKGGGSW